MSNTQTAAAAAVATEYEGEQTTARREWARVFERRCKPTASNGVGKEVAAILKFLDLVEEQKSAAGADKAANIGLALTNVLAYYAPTTADTLATDTTSTTGTGQVTKWFSARGFGFIKPDGSSDDLFAHMSEIEGKFNALAIGKTVSFVRAFNAERGNFQATKVTGDGCIRARMGNRPRGICFDFQKGACTRGASCRFSHTRSSRGGRGGRGRGYGGRGRGRNRGGGYNMNAYTYGYVGGMYGGGMPYGGGYGVPYGGGYEGMYGGYPMNNGYNGGGYGGYPQFPNAASGSYGGGSFGGMYSGSSDAGPAPADTGTDALSPTSNGGGDSHQPNFSPRSDSHSFSYDGNHFP